MKLHSPEFEKRLKRLVRETVRRSPELRKEARRVRKAKHYNANAIGRVLLAIPLGLLVAWAARESNNPQAPLAVITLWMLLWLCWRVNSLMGDLYSDATVQALVLLPVPRQTIFRWQLQGALRKSVTALIDLLAGFIAFGFAQEIARDGPQKSVSCAGVAAGTEHQQVGLGLSNGLFDDDARRAVPDMCLPAGRVLVRDVQLSKCQPK